MGRLRKPMLKSRQPVVVHDSNANSVPIGATYIAVNAQEVWQSNGTDWVVM